MAHKAPFYNFLSVIIVRILPALLYIYALPVFFEAHGVEAYAQIVLIFTIVSLSVIFESASNYFFFNSFSVRSENSLPRIMRLYCDTLWLLTSGLYSFCAIAAIIYFVYNIELIFGLVILLAITPAILGSSLIFSFWQARNKGYIGNSTRSLIDILKAGGLFIGGSIDNGEMFAIYIYVAGFYIRFFVDYLVFRKSGGHIDMSKTPMARRAKIINLFLKKTYPIWITTLISSVLQFLDKPISHFLFGESEMVRLALAAEVSSKVVIIQYAVAFAFTYYFGKAARMRSEDLRLTGLFLGVILAIIVIFLIPLYIHAKTVLTVWLGAKAAEQSYELLRLLLIAQAIYMLGNVFEVRNTFTAAAQRNIIPYVLMFFTYFISLFVMFDKGINAIAYSLIFAQAAALLYYSRKVFQ